MARLGLECYVFIPDNLEPAKVLGSAIYRPHIIAVAGNYDDVNRLCTQIADQRGWGFANINLRTYYAEGAKMHGLEIAEQLGWRFPSRRVPCGWRHALAAHRARVRRALAARVGAGRATAHARRAGGGLFARHQRARRGRGVSRPVKPQTVAKSIAIGNPADGHHVLEAVRASGGTGARVMDEQILSAAQLLAETEGVFTEPAGGATLAGAIQLIESGSFRGMSPSSSASRERA